MFPLLLRVAGGQLLRNGGSLVRGEAECCCGGPCDCCPAMPETITITLPDNNFEFEFCRCDELALSVHDLEYLGDCEWGKDYVINCPGDTRNVSLRVFWDSECEYLIAQVSMSAAFTATWRKDMTGIDCESGLELTYHQTTAGSLAGCLRTTENILITW